MASLKTLDFFFTEGGEKKSFDPSVGELIEKETDMIGFQTFDFNNDDAEDILTIQKDGYLKLFQNAAVDG